MAETKADDTGRSTTRSSTGSATRSGSRRSRSCWCAREPAQDLVGQAPALAVQGPVPRRRPPAGLNPPGADGRGRPSGRRPPGPSRAEWASVAAPRGHGTADPPTLPGSGRRTATGRNHPAVAAVDGADRRAAWARASSLLAPCTATPRVLRRRLQLRRDVPRDPGPGHPRGRQPLRGGGRPQAAARALRLRGAFELFGTTELWSVRVLAMLAAALTALLLAIEARRRYGSGARVGRRDPVRRVDDRVRAPGRAGRELRDLHAPGDDRRGAPRAARPASASGAAVAVATLAKQTGAATLLPVLYLAGGRAAGAASPTPRSASRVPVAVVALLVGPGQLLYWTVLGNGSYVSVKTASTYVLSTFVLMTLTWVACNLPILCELPRAWRDRRLTSRDGRDRHRPVAVAASRRRHGHGRPALLRPLLPAARTTAVPAHRRRARRAARGASRPRSSRSPRRAARVLGRRATSCGRSTPSPNYQTVSKYLADAHEPGDRVAVWGSVPEIYWASNRRRRRASSRRPGFLADVQPGPAREDAAPKDDDPVVWQ